MIRLVTIFTIAFLTPMLSFASIYYVSTSGNNNNAGTSTSNAWLTIQYAIDNVSAGDEIQVLEGIYTELVTFNNSGNASDGKIILKNYGNDQPVIDASGLGVGLYDMVGIIKIEDHDFIEISGFELRNLTTSSDGLFPSGIWVIGDSHDIDINNNKVHGIQHNSIMGGAHGIAVYGTKANGDIYNVKVNGNEIYDCILAYSECLVLNGNVRDFEVNYNKVHDNNNIGIDFIGHEGTCPDPALDQARDGVCIGNLVYEIDSRNNPVYGGDANAGGIYVDGGKNILVEQNEIHNTNLGIEIASEWINQMTSEITVRNNFVYDCHVVGLAIGGYDDLRGETRNCHIVNNTFYGNDTDAVGWGAELLVQFYCYDNVIKNNVFHAKHNGVQMAYWNPTGSNNDFDNNIYFNTGDAGFSWQGNYHPSLASLQSATGQETNSSFQDPLLIDGANGDLRLSSNSPCIDAGVDFDSSIIGEEDFDGVARVVGSGIDIGASEYFLTTNTHVLTSADCIEVLPNPFSDLVYVSGEFEDYTIEVLDVSGATVMDLTGSVSPITIDLSSLGSGIYFLRLEHTTDPQVFVEKIIKM